MALAALVFVVAALRLGAVPSYLVAVIASQLLSPILWDHYALLLLLPVAWLMDRGLLVGGRLRPGDPGARSWASCRRGSTRRRSGRRWWRWWSSAWLIAGRRARGQRDPPPPEPVLSPAVTPAAGAVRTSRPAIPATAAGLLVAVGAFLVFWLANQGLRRRTGRLLLPRRCLPARPHLDRVPARLPAARPQRRHRHRRPHLRAVRAVPGHRAGAAGGAGRCRHRRPARVRRQRLPGGHGRVPGMVGGGPDRRRAAARPVRPRAAPGARARRSCG